MLRLYSYTNQGHYRTLAQRTLQVFAGVAEQFGIFAASYGMAVSLYSRPQTQVVVVGEDELAERLYGAAVASFALGKAVLRLTGNEAAPQNLPPALGETIPHLPAIKEGKSAALVCSGFACHPPVNDPAILANLVRECVAAPGGRPDDASAAD